MITTGKSKIKEMLSLYFIMGSTNCKQDPVYVLEQAIAGGITLFQYREKGIGALHGMEKVRLAEKLQQVCKDAGIPFIVNDDLDLAIALDADGVHVGQEDEAASYVRQRIGNKILGVSTHSLTEAHHAIAHGADYLGLGAIYTTYSKDDIVKIHGTDIIRSFREANITIPIVGIGGITSSNAKEIIEAGANGVAVISAIAGADNVKQATAQLRMVLK